MIEHEEEVWEPLLYSCCSQAQVRTWTAGLWWWWGSPVSLSPEPVGSDGIYNSGQLVSELLGGNRVGNPQIWCQKCCEYENKGQTVSFF